MSRRSSHVMEVGRVKHGIRSSKNDIGRFSEGREKRKEGRNVVIEGQRGSASLLLFQNRACCAKPTPKSESITLSLAPKRHSLPRDMYHFCKLWRQTVSCRVGLKKIVLMYFRGPQSPK